MPASSELSEAVLSQRRLIERLLVHGRRETGEEPSLRSPDAGDPEFVKNLQIFLRLADVFDEQPGTVGTWRSLYGDELPPLLPGGVTRHAEAAQLAGPDEVEATRGRLARLMRVKESQTHFVKARWALKQRVAGPTILVLLLAVAAFAVAVAGMAADDRALWSAAAAGGAGAALGGLIRLRDEVTLGSQARQFLLFFVGQVVVGVAAGMLTFLVDGGGLITVAGGSAGVAAVAFAVGFSEAAFVGLLNRLGGSPAAG